ncbi:MAG: ribosomal protein S18-alanine N-acetyltransferase [Elusimicrobia bacterium]|nr:ribosomal protein S18-alanine N-acetyltransferase [Elusimicrobiota bacterium]MDE2313121.1 ribosomal protein S18-alanine N-acetyltransferase [Elusimicrobiota bacterium]
MKNDGIRPARPADLDALLAIEARWPTAPGWSRAQFEREMSWERSYFVVLEENGAVAGYAGLWEIPPEGQVTTIAVAPESSGRGLGRRLLNALLGRCRERGLSSVTLEVSAKNPAAIALYESSGFRVVGRRPKFYNDGSDALLMDLSLEAS